MEKEDICEQEFADMLFSVEHPLRCFKKTLYEQSFLTYMEAHQGILKTVSELYRQDAHYPEFYHKIVQGLLSQVHAHMQGLKKRTMAKLLTDYNLILVIYVFPAFLRYDKIAGQIFVEEVLHQWKENFMQTNLKAVTFEEISAGFEGPELCGIMQKSCS